MTIIEKIEHQTATWATPKARQTLSLRTNDWERIDPPWWLVQIALNGCNGKCLNGIWRYCVLSQIERGTYVQAAYSGSDENHEWRLEWRITASDGSYTHCYATERNEESRRNQTLKSLVPVISTFLEFFNDGDLPDEFEWHVVDI